MLKSLARSHPYITLFALALLCRLAVAWLFQHPGYSDAYYYSDIAQNLWQGQGFRENFIWNYLGRPLPTAPFHNPSSTYWLPLTSLLIYLSYFLSGGTDFWAAQLPMVLISAALAPLSYYIALDIFGPTLGKRYGWLTGLLTIFCGVYALYFSLPDNFAPFALLTCLFLVYNYKVLRLPKNSQQHRTQALKLMALAGVVAGLSYLTRVDGVLLLAVAVLSLVVCRYVLRQQTALSWSSLGLMLLTFGLTVSPWLWHNLQTSGQLFPGGGLKTLFMREYDDFYSYSKPLDLGYYLNQADPSPSWGLFPLILSKLDALWQNLLLLGRGTLFFMLPLFGLGLFSRFQNRLPEPLPAQSTALAAVEKERAASQTYPPNLELSWKQSGTTWRRPEFLPFVLYLVVLYLAMSLLFTFPSTRGSIFHSSGGLLPFFAAIIAVGLDAFIIALGKLSRPKAAAARLRAYSRIIVGAAILMSIFFVITPPLEWQTTYVRLEQVNNWLDSHGYGSALLMVPDVPAYNYVTHKAAIVISSDPLPVDLALAKRYGVSFLLLQPDHAPAALNPLYLKHTYPGFKLVARFGEVELYQLDTPAGVARTRYLYR